VVTTDEVATATLVERPVTSTDAACSKPALSEVTSLFDPVARSLGLALVRLGPAVTVRHPGQVTVPLASETVTSRGPRMAEVFTLAVMVTRVEVTLTRAGDTPPPETVTTTGETNPVPVMITRALAPWAISDGATDEMEMGRMGTTVLEAPEDALVPTPFVATTLKV
jgi:hypothetical protein